MGFLNIRFNPIGSVKTELSDEEVKNAMFHDLEAEIEIFAEYAEGLEAIDDFSHLLVFFYLHKVTEKQRKLLKARPRRLIKYGLNLDDLPLVGVFCLDSPHRPNPIGLSVVKLLRRKGRLLRVRGLDAFNGTPVIDLKP
jgi:tRNA-Thr(GGU) m(6)t(6)A37 methyltransferase TsaA